MTADPPAFTFTPGRRPVLVSIPHGGTYVPPRLAAVMTDAGRALADTDWHLGQLYDFAAEIGASVLAATHSRYVIDVNRPADGSALYPGARNTELCPLTTFDFQPIWAEGAAPDAAEVARRVELLWRPYHQAIADALARLQEQFGAAVLYEAHSIQRRVPRFFEGALPDLNLGTVDGAACALALADRLTTLCAGAAPLGYSYVRDGRFKGGHITRSFGRPTDGLHAVQMELVQETYMEEMAPFHFREDRADRIRPVLRGLVQACADFVETTANRR